MLTHCLRCCSAVLLIAAACGEVPLEELAADKADSQQAERLSQLEGNYLLQVLSTSVFLDTETRETTTMRTEIRAKIQAAADETGSVLTLVLCQLKLPKVSGFEPVLPQETLALLPAAVARVRVVRQQEGGLQLESDRFSFTIGLDLDDPLHDPIPVAADHPAVVDLDNDRKPGVTLRVAGFSVYLAARLTCELFGQVALDAQQRQLVQGSLNIAMDQQIYGDSIPFFDVAEGVAASDKTQELVSTEHTFWLLPAADEQSCAKINGTEQVI